MDWSRLRGEQYVRLTVEAAEAIAPFLGVAPDQIEELALDLADWPEEIRPSPLRGRDGRLSRRHCHCGHGHRGNGCRGCRLWRHGRPDVNGEERGRGIRPGIQANTSRSGGHAPAIVAWPN